MITETRNWILLWIGIAVSLMVLVIAVELGRQPAPPVETEPTETTLAPPETNPLSTKDFGYDGEYLTCLTEPSIRGIDVSSYQKDVDWEAVLESGVEYVIIRVGYRGYTKGNLYPDPLAQEHYQGAKAAGLKIGCYYFSQAITPQEAEEEARYTLEQIRDWELDMPVVYDWEYLGEEYRTASLDARTLTECTLAFCQTVKQAGYEPMVYFNSNQSKNQLYLEELTDYRFWLALYSEKMEYPYRVDMWQYTNKGSVPGISGNVDINLYFPWESA